jgi:hypothetical protein
VFLQKAGDESAPVSFSTDGMCVPTKILVQRGVSYVVTVTVSSPWFDKGIAATPTGFGTSTLSDWPTKIAMYSALPLRRVIFRRWFSLLGRIGSKGVAEVFLDPTGTSNTFRGRISKAERDGELFLYVNDAALPLPWVGDIFYRNNRGTAQVVVRRLN